MSNIDVLLRKPWRKTGIWLIWLAAFSLIPLRAEAQTHPCDAPDATSGRAPAGTPLKVQFCQALSDNIVGVTVYNGSTPSQGTGLTQVTPTPNAQGKVKYEAFVGSFTVGTYTLQFATTNLDAVNNTPQEGGKSAPFSLTVVVPTPVPTAPAIKRVGS